MRGLITNDWRSEPDRAVNYFALRSDIRKDDKTLQENAPLVRIIDDSEEMRKIAEDLFKGVGIEVASYEVGSAFFDSDPLSRVGCLIADVRMPGMSGLDVQRRVAQQAPHIPVILVTGFGEVAMGVEAMKSGAFDFLEKPVSLQRLLDVATRAIDKSISTMANRQELSALATFHDSLSDRERDVADKIAKGNPNKVIAADLKISEKTVEFHRANIMKKMEARNSAELIRKLVLLETAAV